MVKDTFTIYIHSILSPKQGNRLVWCMWLKGCLGSFPVGSWLTRKGLERKLEKVKEWLSKRGFEYKVEEK